MLPSTFYYKLFCFKFLTQEFVEPLQRFGCKRAWSSVRIYDAKPVWSITINSLCFSNAWVFRRIKVLLLHELFSPKQFSSVFPTSSSINILANVQKTALMTWIFSVSSLKISVSNLLNKSLLPNNSKYYFKLIEGNNLCCEKE